MNTASSLYNISSLGSLLDKASSPCYQIFLGISLMGSKWNKQHAATVVACLSPVQVFTCAQAWEPSLSQITKCRNTNTSSIKQFSKQDQNWAWW